MDYKLIAIDMDGTFLNEENELMEENLEAVQKAIEKGCKVMIATGRSGEALIPYADKIQFGSPFVVYNGAGYKFLDTKDYIFRSDVPYEIAKKVYEKGMELNTCILVWADDVLYATGTGEFMSYYTNHTSFKFEIVEDFEIFKDKGIHKVLFSDTPERIREMYESVKENVFEGLNITISIPKILEFFNEDVSKGLAVLKYAEEQGIKQEEIICIGDGMNDLSMIEMAGLGVAMGNACEELKSVANFIAKTNTECGVAQVINEFVLNK